MDGCVSARDGGAKVQIGAITYSFRKMPRFPFSELGYAAKTGLDTVELMGDHLELAAGAPGLSANYGVKRSKEDWEALGRWRKSARDDVFAPVKARYDEAGVGVHIVKFSDIGASVVPDWQMEYYFRAAKAMGAKAITRELPKPEEREGTGRRLAEWADRFGVRVAFHNHLQINALTYDGPLLGYSPNLGINFDIGHYVASNDDDPLDFVRKYADRIVSIHVKDRTRAAHKARNLPFGRGDTPIGPLLRLIRDSRLPIHADIELEYHVPGESDAVREVARCAAYCRAELEKEVKA
jgi:sugar phosphate isomerase/epimerase